MYGLIRCESCGRPRVADLSKKQSGCPYCGATADTGSCIVYYTSNDQASVRDALAKASGFTAPDGEAKKKRIAEADPLSTLARRYERCSDLETKMAILAEGLSEIKGAFTMEDVRGIAGTRAEKMVAAMLDRCLIYEARPGLYRMRRRLPPGTSLFLPSIFSTSLTTPGRRMYMLR